ncbi:MAG TPA: phospholipase D family protein [Candidatus Acidoferrales bacterium]|nr:phospholipase D family protein [Candidatus Acidoferrales bacterium]
MISELLSAVDGQIGETIDGANRRHHIRRLKRLGWDRALHGSSGWGSGTRPSEGNQVDVHIDGAAALPAMAAAVRGARSFVHVAGWTVNPDFAMERTPELVTLRQLLAEAATRVDVRVLVWAGAPVPVMHPSRPEAKQLMDRLVRGTRIRGALDRKNRPMHCHHEKLIIVDGTLAFVGGIDLTDLAGDRFDGPPHDKTTQLGWHDVAASLTGPAVADVAAHFAMRWTATTGESLPTTTVPAPAGSSRVQIIRTVPEKTYAALPKGDFSLLEAYSGAIRRAKRLIYLENQFLWSTEIVALLQEKLSRPPTEGFRLIMVLPRHPNNGNDDTRGQLSILKAADRNNRLLFGTVGTAGRERPGVYVHAKVGIIDDEWLTVGSANLNEHSLFNDTEVNLVTDDATLARRVREQLWSEHLAKDCTGRDPLQVIETEWRRALAAPPSNRHPLRRLPAVSRRSARLLGPLKGLLVDG